MIRRHLWVALQSPIICPCAVDEFSASHQPHLHDAQPEIIEAKKKDSIPPPCFRGVCYCGASALSWKLRKAFHTFMKVYFKPGTRNRELLLGRFIVVKFIIKPVMVVDDPLLAAVLAEEATYEFEQVSTDSLWQLATASRSPWQFCYRQMVLHARPREPRIANGVQVLALTMRHSQKAGERASPVTIPHLR